MKKRLFTLLAFFSLLSGAAAQNIIRLVNPSFEDEPKHSVAPAGWYNCGMEEESPPDIQPGSFLVATKAQDGETYVGLVVRDNNTWESLGQKLSMPLEKDSTYSFKAYLARAELYLSISRTTQEQANYAQPIGLRIWGGNKFCEKGELLAETLVVGHTRWRRYSFEFRPRKDSWNYILLEASYDSEDEFAYNGNILIDNCSEIVKKQ
jgi:hypothetical protein